MLCCRKRRKPAPIYTQSDTEKEQTRYDERTDTNLDTDSRNKATYEQRPLTTYTDPLMSAMNPLLSFLFNHPNPSQKFRDQVAQLAHSNYAILVPQISLDDHCDAELTPEAVFSHVIRISHTGENQRARYFASANGRTVIFKNDQVMTYRGYKNNVTVNIVDQYVYTPVCWYLPRTCFQNFLVYEISGYLTEKPLPEAPKEIDQNQYDGPSFEDILLIYPNVGRQLSRLLATTFDNYTSTAANTEELDLEFERATDRAIEYVQAIDPLMVRRIIEEQRLTETQLEKKIDEYVESQLSRKLWNALIALRTNEDGPLDQAVESIKYLSLNQVDLPENEKHWEAKVVAAANVLQTLANTSTNESLPCNCRFLENTLMKCIDTLTDDSIQVNADVLVSLLLVVVARANISHLNSTIYYIRSFSSNAVDSGKLGYMLSTLEAVMYHIGENREQLEAISEANRWFFERVEKGDLTEFDFERPSMKSGLQRDDADWKTVFAATNPAGESALMCAVSSNQQSSLTCLLDHFGYTQEDILADRSVQGSTLLVSALRTENEDIIKLVLDRVRDCADLAHYLSVGDEYGRSVGHYFFHSLYLQQQVGSLINWTARDNQGQTPLSSLCRSYDNPDYHALFKNALKTCLDATGMVDLRVHTDAKGNTLLHTVSDEKVLSTLLNHPDVLVNVNQPNKRGMTALMAHAKYARLKAIEVLCKDPRIDFAPTDNKGMNVFDIARDRRTADFLDECYMSLQPNLGETDKYCEILRSVIADGELCFVIKTRQDGKLSAVRRPYSDFVFLQKWLAHEQPLSWFPALMTPTNPFAIPHRPSREILHAMHLRLNLFLRTLLLHPTFSNHELLWEWLLVQDISHTHLAERTTKKLENKKEKDLEEYIILGEPEMDEIEGFVSHALQQVDLMRKATMNLHQASVKLCNAHRDYCKSWMLMKETVDELKEIPGTSPRENIIANLSSAMVTLGDTFRINNSSPFVFSCYIESLQNMADATTLALAHPLAQISHLRLQQMLLVKLQADAVALSEKKTFRDFFHDREKEIRLIKNRIHITENEIRRLSMETKNAQITLASELGGFYQVHEHELTLSIKNIVSRIIKRHKELQGDLEEIQRRFI